MPLPTPTTPPVDPLAGLPLGAWANLPLIVGGTFLLISLIGLSLIIRKNRQMEIERSATDLPSQRNTDL